MQGGLVRQFWNDKVKMADHHLSTCHPSPERALRPVHSFNAGRFGSITARIFRNQQDL
jgi:hypothetical protein